MHSVSQPLSNSVSIDIDLFQLQVVDLVLQLLVLLYVLHRLDRHFIYVLLFCHSRLLFTYSALVMLGAFLPTKDRACILIALYDRFVIVEDRCACGMIVNFNLIHYFQPLFRLGLFVPFLGGI